MIIIQPKPLNIAIEFSRCSHLHNVLVCVRACIQRTSEYIIIEFGILEHRSMISRMSGEGGLKFSLNYFNRSVS